MQRRPGPARPEAALRLPQKPRARAREALRPRQRQRRAPEAAAATAAIEAANNAAAASAASTAAGGGCCDPASSASTSTRARASSPSFTSARLEPPRTFALRTSPLCSLSLRHARGRPPAAALRAVDEAQEHAAAEPQERARRGRRARRAVRRCVVQCRPTVLICGSEQLCASGPRRVLVAVAPVTAVVVVAAVFCELSAPVQQQVNAAQAARGAGEHERRAAARVGGAPPWDLWRQRWRGAGRRRCWRRWRQR